MEEFSDIRFLLDHDQEEAFFYCDEVGRGPLAGPVVSSSVTLIKKDDDFFNDITSVISFLTNLGVTDSKKLTSKKRIAILDALEIDVTKLKPGKCYRLRVDKTDIYYSLGECSHFEIDDLNILKASLRSMEKSVLQLMDQYRVQRGVCLIDGKFPIKNNRFRSFPLIGGDRKSCFVALASIIAKEYRDFYMEELHKDFPVYGFDKHAGYPTKLHKEMIQEHGVSPVHRRSFKGVKEFCL